MGSFFTSFHIRTGDPKVVAAALRAAQAVPAYVSSEPGEWMSVYPEPTESQDTRLVKTIAQRLSREFHCGVIAFLVHDSDVFYYCLYEDGKQADEYDSWPGYFYGKRQKPKGGNPRVLLKYCAAGATEERLQRLLRDRQPDASPMPSESLGRLKEELEKQRQRLTESYFQMVEQTRRFGAPIPALEEILRQVDQKTGGMISGQSGAETLAEGLGQLLGLSPQRCTVGYNYIQQGEAPQGVVFLVA